MREPNKDSVGILVGEIQHFDPPLVYELVVDEKARRYATVVGSYPGQDIMSTLASVRRQCGLEHFVWRNETVGRWFYVQLKRFWTPNRLAAFALPWSVYCHWEQVTMALE